MELMNIKYVLESAVLEGLLINRSYETIKLSYQKVMVNRSGNHVIPKESLDSVYFSKRLRDMEYLIYTYKDIIICSNFIDIDSKTMDILNHPQSMESILKKSSLFLDLDIHLFLDVPF